MNGSMLAPLQKNVVVFWTRQKTPQRVTLIMLALAAVIIIPVLLVWASTPTYGVAFSGMSEADAGLIVEKLDEAKISYQLKDSGTILVESDQVYDVRLRMAREGLPETSTVGYELFSGNTFGMTEFTQRVNYQRALEGELERTISSLDSIDSVRVHVVTPEKRLISSEQSPTTASVTIQERLGQTLDAGQVRAIINLVSGSIEGLTPENVVVVDTEGNLLSGGDQSLSDNATSLSDQQRAAEDLAAADVRKRVQTMLDTILGAGNSVVQASVAIDWNQREVTSNMYDPTPAAIRSSQIVNESYNTNGQTTGGVPGAESNLPTPVATAGAADSTYAYRRSEETINYEISQTQSKEVITPGQIQRISVSVMVDAISDPAQLQTIRAAAAAAAGINETRGDQIVVESISFDRTGQETATAAAAEEQKQQQMIMIGSAVAAVLALFLLLFFFLRVLKSLQKSSREAWTPIMQPVRQLAQQEAASAQLPAASHAAEHTASTPVIANRTAEPAVVVQLSQQQKIVQQETEQRVKVITRLAEENPATVAEIIQLWLNEEK